MNIVGRKLLEQYYSEAEERAYISRIPNAGKRYRHFLDTKASLANRIPLKYIASYLGMTIETLSRIRSARRSGKLYSRNSCLLRYRLCSNSCRNDEFSTRRSDCGLGFRSELLSVFLRIRHIDFSDQVHGRLCLRVQTLDQGRASHGGYDRQSNRVLRLHDRYSRLNVLPAAIECRDFSRC